MAIAPPKNALRVSRALHEMFLVIMASVLLRTWGSKHFPGPVCKWHLHGRIIHRPDIWDTEFFRHTVRHMKFVH